MPLGKHSRTQQGTFRRERSDSTAVLLSTRCQLATVSKHMGPRFAHESLGTPHLALHA
jgi:hypothetical protein